MSGLVEIQLLNAIVQDLAPSFSLGALVGPLPAASRTA
jgi:hypothetical protein